MPQAAFLALMFLAPQAASTVGAGPEPAPTPISWELDIKFLDPERIEVQLPGQAEPEVYWYMVYTVTNPGSRSQFFFPTFQLVTDDLRVIDTDTGISKLVFDAIAERHRITHKYLMRPTRVIGELLMGDDNARESVAIWRANDLNVNSFTIYVAGLSGETQFIHNPAYDPSQPERVEVGADGKERVVNPRHFTLRKTLEISYNLPGSPGARTVAAPERQAVRWVMR
ncbi:MAG: hypothetical protein PVJ57_02205 [Phycisphaerae bacterium]|jgi:hypothetical protein